MGVLTRRIVWRNPFAVERVPLIGRLHRAAYAPSARLREELFKLPLRPLLAAAYRLGLGGTGAFRLRVRGEEKRFAFDGRNLQFVSLYMPQHEPGYEPDTAALLDILVAPDGVFHDVGSNWGYFALRVAAREGFRGKVHAFEPVPAAFRDLERLAREAGLASCLAAHNKGLSDSDRRARMTVPDGMHGGLATVCDGGGIAVELARLDGLGLEPPTVMKIDAEDHEVEVLDGAAQTIARAKPFVLFESSADRAPERKLAPFERLSALGYSFFHPAWRTDDGRFVPSVPLREGEAATVALLPFAPEQRFLFRPLLNVLACHRDRRAELEARFS